MSQKIDPGNNTRSNQSILKEINPGISSKGMMVKLKLQYFGHLMRSVDSLEKTLMLGKIEGRRRRGRQRMRWLDGIMTQWTWVGWTLGVGDGQGGVVCCGLWGHKESDTTEWLNWTELPGQDTYSDPKTGEDLKLPPQSDFWHKTNLGKWWRSTTELIQFADRERWFSHFCVVCFG